MKRILFGAIAALLLSLPAYAQIITGTGVSTSGANTWSGTQTFADGGSWSSTGIAGVTHVAIGGCTIGTNSFCVTGTSNLAGTTVSATGGFVFNDTVDFNNNATSRVLSIRFGASSDAILRSPGAATFQLGNADAAAPVAQTLGVQNVVAGTSNTAGVATTLRNSAGTGTGLGGNTIFQYAPHDTTHTVNTFTGSASPYTIGFTAGNITTYPIGTVMTVSGCTTATLNGTYTVTASSSGSVTATTTATGTGSPTTCLIVGNTSQNAFASALTINGDTAAATFTGNIVENSAAGNAFLGSVCVGNTTCANSTTYLSRSNGIAIASWGTGGIGWAPSTDPSATPDTVFWRSASGVVDLGNSSTDNTAGSLKFASYIAGGTAPVGSGTCTRGTQTGGLTAGSIVLTCTAQTLILTFTTTAPTGWMCEAIDQTTVADTMKQTANSTTSCTLTGTTAASDVVIYQARAY